MGNDAEQLTNKTEETNLTSGTEQQGKASTQDAQTSKVENVWDRPEVKKEMDSRIFRAVQSALDKQSKKQTKTIDIEEKAKHWLQDEDVPAEKVESFKEAAKQLKAKVDRYNESIEEIEARETKIGALESEAKAATVLKKILSTVLPDANLKDVIESLVKEADSEKSLELLAEKAANQFKEKLTPKTVPRPDGAFHSAGGGSGKLTIEQIRKMTPQEIMANSREIAKLNLTI